MLIKDMVYEMFKQNSQSEYYHGSLNEVIDKCLPNIISTAKLGDIMVIYESYKRGSIGITPEFIGNHQYSGRLIVTLSNSEEYILGNALETPILGGKDYKSLIETCKCTNCGKITPFTDEGGRCETDFGWLCNDCIEKLSKQYELHFEDEEMYDDED